MTELPKRQLGRTGLQVTQLGYGAMELRGRRAAGPSRMSRPRHSPRRSRRRDQLHRHLDRLRPERGAHRPLYRCRRLGVLPRLKCGCLVGARQPRGRTSRTSSRARTSWPAWSRACAACAPTTWTWSSSTPPRPGDARGAGRAGGPVGAAARGQGALHRHVGHAAQSTEQIAWASSTSSRSPIGGRARARGVDRGGRQSGCRDRHPGRGRQGAAPGASARGSVGSVATGRPPGPARRNVVHGVRLTVHLHPPRCTRTSWGQSTPPISSTTSTCCGKARCPRTSTPRPSGASTRRAQLRGVAEPARRRGHDAVAQVVRACCMDASIRATRSPGKGPASAAATHSASSRRFFTPSTRVSMSSDSA